MSGRSLRLLGRGGPDHRHDPGANNLGQPGPPGHDGDAHSPRSSISSNSSPSKLKSDRWVVAAKPAGTYHRRLRCIARGGRRIRVMTAVSFGNPGRHRESGFDQHVIRNVFPFPQATASHHLADDEWSTISRERLRPARCQLQPPGDRSCAAIRNPSRRTRGGLSTAQSQKGAIAVQLQVQFSQDVMSIDLETRQAVSSKSVRSTSGAQSNTIGFLGESAFFSLPEVAGPTPFWDRARCPLSSLSGAGSHGSSRPDGTSLDDLRGRRRADSDTTEILESYPACKTKAYLKLHGKLGTKSDYEALSTETRAELRNRAAQMPVSRLKPEEVIRGVKITETALVRVRRSSST